MGAPFASIAVLSMGTWRRLRKVHREARRSIESQSHQDMKNHEPRV